MRCIAAVLVSICLSLGLLACSESGESGAGAKANIKPALKQYPDDPDIKARYTQSCYSCHAFGAGGAPRSGLAQDWQPRLTQGMEVLLEHTIQGYKGMPPLGMCMDCGEQEFVALIRFMSGQE